MVNIGRPQSKRRLALELCRKLLNLLDAEKVSTSGALRSLSRISQLNGDKELVESIDKELDSFSLVGSSHEDTRTGAGRRMNKDHERLPESAEAFTYVAMSRLMARRLVCS